MRVNLFNSPWHKLTFQKRVFFNYYYYIGSHDKKMAYSEIKILIFLTVKSVSLRIRIYYDNNFNNYFLSCMSSVFLSFSFFFCILYFFFSYIPFKFTYIACGRGLQDQWLLSHALLTYNRNSHLFHSFIHFSQNARQWAPQISCNHYVGTLLVFRKLFFIIHMKTAGALPMPSTSSSDLMGRSTWQDDFQVISASMQ